MILSNGWVLITLTSLLSNLDMTLYYKLCVKYIWKYWIHYQTLRAIDWYFRVDGKSQISVKQHYLLNSIKQRNQCLDDSFTKITNSFHWIFIQNILVKLTHINVQCFQSLISSIKILPFFVWPFSTIYFNQNTNHSQFWYLNTG